MDCREIKAELVHYAKREVPAELESEIASHIESCESCRAEYESISRTLDTVHETLVPIEPSADFRAALRNRIEQATSSVTRPSANISNRLRRSEERAPFFSRVVRQVRRSPYFAASLALHIVAIALLATLVMRNMEDESPRLVIDEPIKESPARDSRFLAWQARRSALRINKEAARQENGALVDVTEFMNKGELLMTGNEQLGCVNGYFVESAHPAQNIQPVKNGKILIPENLFATYMGSSFSMTLLHMEDRIEFWPSAGWKSLEASFSVFRNASPLPAGNHNTFVATHERAAILPLRNGRDYS